jgi:hypothetical protein
MLFRRAVFLCAALTASASALAYLLLIQVRSSDTPRYRRLVQESAELRSRRALEKSPAHQLREGVQKDIWAIDGSERLHFRLTSGYSELTLRQKKDKVEAVEELRQINCWIQEEIDRAGNAQQVRFVSASEGTYDYPSHRFLAHSVHLAFYRIPGLDLPLSLTEKPFLSGVAREVAFAATSKIPTFTAYHLTAQLDPERGLP